MATNTVVGLAVTAAIAAPAQGASAQGQGATTGQKPPPRGAARTIQASPGVLSAKTPGWEFARWGMTPNEVRAASHGTVISKKGDNQDDFLTGEYVMDSFRFSADIAYAPQPADPQNYAENNLALDGVVLGLDLKSGNCASLATYLKKIFGAPDTAQTDGPMYPAYLVWHKKDIDDDITYIAWPDKSCAVQYNPLGTS